LKNLKRQSLLSNYRFLAFRVSWYQVKPWTSKSQGNTQETKEPTPVCQGKYACFGRRADAIENHAIFCMSENLGQSKGVEQLMGLLQRDHITDRMSGKCRQQDLPEDREGILRLDGGGDEVVDSYPTRGRRFAIKYAITGLQAIASMERNANICTPLLWVRMSSS
jgi:hypothetical protein